MNDTLPHGNENLQLNINTKRPHDIFDRIFKRIITLSSATIVRFINGIFNADYPIDSTITYNWTENVDDKLKKTIADTIISILMNTSTGVIFILLKSFIFVFKSLFSISNRVNTPNP